MAHPHRLHAAHAQLLVVDMQQRMLARIAGQEAVVGQALRMIRAASQLELPITICQQEPQALGGTEPRLVQAAGEAPRLDKQSFSVWGAPGCKERIGGLMRPQVLLVGVETHICIRQSALDLLGAQMQPFVLADASGARRPADHELALAGLRAAGAVVTTVEAAIFDLLGRAGTECFRRILPIVR